MTAPTPKTPPQWQPYVTVTPCGRWTYRITVHERWTMFTPTSHTLGRRHATAKARRMLRRYLTQKARETLPPAITFLDDDF